MKVAIDTVLTSSPGAPKDAPTAIVEVKLGAKKALLQTQTNLQKDAPTKGATQALHHHQHILKSIDSLEQLLMEPAVTSKSSLTILPETVKESLDPETRLKKIRKSGAPENAEDNLSPRSKLPKLSDTRECKKLDSSNAEFISVPEEMRSSEMAFLVGEQQTPFKMLNRLQEKHSSSMRVSPHKSSLAAEYSSNDQCASEKEISMFKSRSNLDEAIISRGREARNIQCVSSDPAQAKESSKFRLRSPWGCSISSDKDPKRFSEQDASSNIPHSKFHLRQYPTIQERKEGSTASNEELSSAGGCLSSEEAGHIDTKDEDSMDEVPGDEININ